MTNKNHHFTLLELLVTTALIALLMVTLFTVSGNVMNKWQLLSDSNRHFENILKVERIFDNTIPNAVPFVWRDPDDSKLRVNTFYGGKDSVTFCYLHRMTNLEEGAIRFIGFQLVEDQLVAYYKDRPYLQLDNLDETVTESVIADNIESVEFKYVRAEANQGEADDMFFEDIWDTEDDEYFDIPLGIRVDVIFFNKGQETFFYRTAGNSLCERWGSWEPRDVREGGGGSAPTNNRDNNSGEPPPGDPNSQMPPGGFR